MSKPTASIIIPTLLSEPELLEKCLESLSNQTQQNLEIIVVVNALKNQSIQLLQKKYSSTMFVELSKNIGFTGAVNMGIKKAQADQIVLLNDDTTVDSKWLSELLKTQKQTGADMVASNIYLSDKKTIDSQGFSFAWRGKAVAITGDTNPLTSFNDYWLNLSNRTLFPKQTQFAEPFGPDAAACLYTKKLFDSVGLFNESFFAYLEDVELALRARKKGFYCVLAKNALVYHYKHTTSQKKNGFKQMQDFKNWWRIVLFTYPKVAWQKFSVIILIERLRNLKGLFLR